LVAIRHQPTPNPSKEGNRRQKVEGKKEGYKIGGNYNCLPELDIKMKKFFHHHA